MDINKDLRNRLAAEGNQSHELTALKFKLQNELHKYERFLHVKDRQLEQLRYNELYSCDIKLICVC